MMNAYPSEVPHDDFRSMLEKIEYGRKLTKGWTLVQNNCCKKVPILSHNMSTDQRTNEKQISCYYVI